MSMNLIVDKEIYGAFSNVRGYFDINYQNLKTRITNNKTPTIC